MDILGGMQLKNAPTPDLCLMIAATRSGGNADPVVIDALTGELENRLTVLTDEDSEPCDVDAALARFLLAFIRKDQR